MGGLKNRQMSEKVAGEAGEWTGGWRDGRWEAGQENSNNPRTGTQGVSDFIRMTLTQGCAHQGCFLNICQHQRPGPDGVVDFKDQKWWRDPLTYADSWFTSAPTSHGQSLPAPCPATQASVCCGDGRGGE